jgi:uncharacterized protein involved in exopolysaccharide biosynthesis
LTQPVVYRATTSIVATPQPPPGSGTAGLRRAPTVDSDAQMLASDRVLANAAEEVEYPGGLPALREDVDVTARSTSRVLRVRISAGSAQRASKTADAVAREFLRIRAAADDARFQAAREAVTAQINRISEQLTAAAQVSEQGTGAIDNPEVAAMRQELAVLQTELSQTTANKEASGFVAEPAAPPHSGVRPLARSTIASATLLGIAIGGGLAVGRHRRATLGEVS